MSIPPPAARATASGASNPNFRRWGALAAATSPQPGDGTSYPNPNVQNNPYIYLAVYSSVPVYEMMVRGIGVMRRRSDSFLNATQILKVAGVDKGKRTKILDKDIAMGMHEKVQGGYGRYQGTWIPFERAVELANSFGVSHLLSPLFDYTAPPPPTTLSQDPAGNSVNSNANASASTSMIASTSTSRVNESPVQEGQSAAAVLNKAREQGLLPDLPDAGSRKRARDSNGLIEEYKRAKLDAPNGFNGGVASANGEVQLRKYNQALQEGAIADDPLRTERHRTALKNIFSIDVESTGGLVPDLSASFPPDIDPDTPIDDNEHTALHWAAALARIPIVQALVNAGADIHRGNNVGETPLIRAVLVTNNSDQDAFPRLLEVLGPSLRTVDEMGRTVLHHAALVAGVKGRASSARYYMESVLEYVARHEKGQFKELVDAQDVHGDTALNIAARVGNRSLVRLLVDVAADKTKPNKLGLRPGDFGVEGDELAVSPAEEILASLRGAPPISAPTQKSHEVLESLTGMLSSLSDDFAAELKTKTDVLDRTRTSLRAATRDLAEQRKQAVVWRAKVASADQQAQRIRNLERALADEDAFDWTGRTELDGTPADAGAGPAFTYRGPASTLSNLPAGISIEFDADPPHPASDSDRNALPHLLRLQVWYERVMGLLRQRVERLEGGNAEQELRLQKIVAGCCGVAPERVEGMLDGLLAALESDGSTLDMARVAGFLQRVKDRSMAEES